MKRRRKLVFELERMGNYLGLLKAVRVYNNLTKVTGEKYGRTRPPNLNYQFECMTLYKGFSNKTSVSERYDRNFLT